MTNEERIQMKRELKAGILILHKNLEFTRWFRDCEEMILNELIENNIKSQSKLNEVLIKYNTQWNKNNKNLYKK